ncbi:hypothetical protein [Sphingomonas koreensis]|uniref:hypothetical protein n=1 Tax=Sphingomonas koreensis TaxID=93064 RepID=UPI000F7F2F69|nr:hypothetical protein [Sphingomonas koreensis]
MFFFKPTTAYQTPLRLVGPGGNIITVMGLAGGIVALASGRFSLGQVAVPVAVGVGAGTGIPIVTSTVTATI